jgi:hypothetical protein
MAREVTPPSATASVCPACAGAPLTNERCPECIRGLRRERRKWMMRGLALSPLLAIVLAPALYPGEAAVALPAIALWLVGPLLLAAFLRRDRGLRSRARARGIAMGHGIWVGLIVVVVGGGLAIVAAGMPHTD